MFSYFWNQKKAKKRNIKKGESFSSSPKEQKWWPKAWLLILRKYEIFYY